MQHDDLGGRGLYPHWVLDNLLPSKEGYGIDDALCLESNLVAPGSGTAATRQTWDTDFSLYVFPNSAARKMQSIVQLPHQYANGTDLSFHVHFIPTTQITNGQTVKFDISYKTAPVYGSFSTRGSGSAIFTSSGTTAADTHLMTQQVVTISGALLSGSSFIVATITRDITDTFTGDILMLGADYHIRKTQLGTATGNPTETVSLI